MTLSQSQKRALAALSQRRFFKLIGGGSFTDAAKIAALTALYSRAGMDCIDIAPEMAVVEAVEAGFQAFPAEIPHPMVMVSLPLDPDPHFRKIELVDSDCILCHDCIPVCPTEALSATDTQLLIEQPLCYGCGRCVALCPTEALLLNPIHPDPQALVAVLQHPLVEAVEIHTRYADPYMWPAFCEQFGPALQGKALAVCLRPDEIAPEQLQAFLGVVEAFVQKSVPGFPLILQIDGAPMSGSDDPEASKPALEAASRFEKAYGARFPMITLSGGINRYTADFLAQPGYDWVSGVGMGTVARRHVWPWLEHVDFLNNPPGEALAAANALVRPFKNRRPSAIMEVTTGP